MSDRKPLVLNDGRVQQLQPSDTLEGVATSVSLDDTQRHLRALLFTLVEQVGISVPDALQEQFELAAKET